MALKKSERFYNSDQSWHYDATYAWKMNKLRVYIRRNSANFQSYIHGYVLDPVRLKWNLVVVRPIEGSESAAANYVLPEKEQEYLELFRKDAAAVVKELEGLV